MAPDPTRRRDVALAALAMAVPLAVGVVALWGRPYFPNADGAVIQMQVRDIPSHMPLYGVYSRFGFHHPGNAMLLWLAPFYKLLGLRGLLLGPPLLHLSALTACAWVLHRRGGRALMVTGTVFLMILERAMVADLLDTWNPWMAVTPFALAILLAWSVWCRDWWMLPWLVGTVSFVVQTHLGYASITAVLVAAALVAAVRHLKGGGPTKAVVLAAIGVAALAWVLPAVEQVKHDPGNLTLIAKALRNPSTDCNSDQLAAGVCPPAGRAGWSDALDSVSQTLGVSAPWLTGAEKLEPFVNRVSPAPLWTLLPTAGAFAAALTVARRRRRQEVLALLILSGACALVGFAAVAQITGQAYPYITRWLWVIAMFLWFSSTWSIVDSWLHRDAPIGGASDPVEHADDPPVDAAAGRRRLVHRVGFAGMAVISVLGAVRAAGADLPRRQSSNNIEHTIDKVLTHISITDDITVVYFEGAGWADEQSGYIVEMERRGYTAWGPDDFAFHIGAHRTPGGRPFTKRLILVVDTPAINVHLERGETPVASWDPLSVDERNEFFELRLRLAVEYDKTLKGEPITNPSTQQERERGAALQAKGYPIAVFLEEVAPAGGTP